MCGLFYKRHGERNRWMTVDGGVVCKGKGRHSFTFGASWSQGGGWGRVLTNEMEVVLGTGTKEKTKKTQEKENWEKYPGLKRYHFTHCVVFSSGLLSSALL